MQIIQRLYCDTDGHEYLLSTFVGNALKHFQMEKEDFFCAKPSRGMLLVSDTWRSQRSPHTCRLTHVVKHPTPLTTESQTQYCQSLQMQAAMSQGWCSTFILFPGSQALSDFVRLVLSRTNAV